MLYRERFEATMKHQLVDRVPFDLAGTSLTSIESDETVHKLCDILGFTHKSDDWYQKFDERILRYFDIDIRRVGDILSPHSDVAGVLSPTEQIDCWGIHRVYTGLYWDIKNPPLKNASVDDLEHYPWPDPERIDPILIDQFRQQARYLYEETGAVVCGEHPVFGVFELGCWMCGFDDFLLKMAMDPDFVRRFFDIVLDYQKRVIEIYYGAVGEYLHFTTSGDDFGTQTGSFISPRMFEKLIKPYYQERIEFTKQFTSGYFFHHTCGSVYALIPHLMEAGVDILNPIQPGAKDMEPDKLKKTFGDRLVFYGGIDTQYLLPYGSTADVEAEVVRVLDAMAGNGGYVLAPAHNIQPDVPAENIVAVYEAARRYFSSR